MNRGVEKRKVVLNDDDRQRFVKSLYVFNDSRPAPNAVTQSGRWSRPNNKRDLLVKIHAWCLMDNHYHILLSPIADEVSNISKFMKKLNMGYAKFFNEKYDRSGYLWQGKYKKVRIERDSHFIHIPYYIHLNPLDFKFKSWRNGNLNNIDQAITFLDDYRWSSWQDYAKKRNFPSILHTGQLSSVLGTRDMQVDEIKRMVSDELKASKSFIIET